MGTSLGGLLNGTRLQHILESRRLEVAEGVTIGVVVGGLLTYFAQHVLQLQRSAVRGRVLQWCPDHPQLVPLGGGRVDAVGSSGPGAGGVFDAPIGADGTYAVNLPPGVYVLAVRDATGRQSPSMVLTTRTASGEVPVTSALELIFDVWSQVLVPASGAVTVDLVVNC